MFTDARAMLANYRDLPRSGNIDPKEWERYFPNLRRKPTKSARSTRSPDPTDLLV